MKFTVEREENNSVSFMDIKTFCDSEKFHTSVYTKHTFSGVTTNFESLFSLFSQFPKSHRNKKRLQNAIERTLPYCKLKVIFKSPSKVVKYFHLKHVLPKKLCSDIL